MTNKLSTTRKTAAGKTTNKSKATVSRSKKSKIATSGNTTTKRAKSTVSLAKKSKVARKTTVTRTKKTKVAVARKTTVTRTKKTKVAVSRKTTTQAKTSKTTVARKPYPKNHRSKKDFKWDQLPTVPFEQICSFLWNSGSCDDLASLRQVNRRMKASVDSFMALSSNQPRLESIVFEMMRGKVYVQFNIHKMNIPFYDMTNLDKRRITRASDNRDGVKVCTLRVIVRNNTDPIIDQARSLFSSTYRAVFVYNLRIVGYSLLSELLGSARIDKLYFVRLPLLDDTVCENIVSLATQTSTKWCIVKTEKSTLTDPGTFITGLDSQLSEGLRLRETKGTATILFGLAAVFWDKFLSEKLRVGAGRTKIWCDKIELTKKRVNVSGFDLNVVEWKK